MKIGDNISKRWEVIYNLHDVCGVEEDQKGSRNSKESVFRKTTREWSVVGEQENDLKPKEKEAGHIKICDIYIRIFGFKQVFWS